MADLRLTTTAADAKKTKAPLAGGALSSGVAAFTRHQQPITDL